MFVRLPVVAAALAFAGIAHADVSPADFTDPNLRPAYSGGANNPVEWSPKYTTDSYAWTEADRAVLRQAANQRRMLEQHQQVTQNPAEALNRFRTVARIAKKSTAPRQLFIVRTAKPIRMEPLRFVGKRAGSGMASRLPTTRVKGSTPAFARLFASAGGGSFSFGSALQSTASDVKPFHFNLVH
jgi:hypothetical protein